MNSVKSTPLDCSRAVRLAHPRTASTAVGLAHPPMASRPRRHNSSPNRGSRGKAWAAVFLVIATVLMAGCGGGGGGGSSTGTTGGTTPTGPAPETLTGTVDFNGAPAAGYTVKFGNGGALTTTTTAQGTFQFNFDASQYSGSQPLLIYDTNGALIDKETVNVNPAGGTQSLGTLNIGPPPPP